MTAANETDIAPDDLHIGDLPAIGTAEELYGIRDDVVHISHDNLSYGPLTEIEPVTRWQSVRTEFWRSALSPGTFNMYREEGFFEPLLPRLRADHGRLQSAGNINLWCGACLSDQFLVAWLATVFLKHLDVDPFRLRLIAMDPVHFFGYPVPSVGALSWEALGPCGPCWQPMDENTLESYEALWLAISGDSPQGLIDFCAAEAPHPENLKQTIRVFMTRYPAVDCGLSHWDKVLLENRRAHPGEMPTTIPYREEIESRNLLVESLDSPDLLHFPSWQLASMSNSTMPNPLLHVHGNLTNLPAAKVFLTRAGERVLDGADNAIALNGIDEWVDGMHLSSKDGTVWLYNGETLVPADPDGTPRKGREGDR